MPASVTGVDSVFSTEDILFSESQARLNPAWAAQLLQIRCNGDFRNLIDGVRSFWLDPSHK